MKKKTALKDIALHVGVSTALVSYVMNNQEKEKRVGQEVAKKIRAAAEELNYRPNQIAKSLKTKKTHTIGLIVADINYRFTTGVTSSIEAEAKKHNYTVIIGSSNEDAKKFTELVDVMVNRQIDGLILVPVAHSDEQIETLKKHDIPFVLIDRYFPNIEANQITIDNFKAAYQLVSHVIKHGYKNIGCINYRTSLSHLLERDKGYDQALKDYHIPAAKGLKKKIRETHRQEDVEKAVYELVNQLPACDAIFFASDTLALAGLSTIVRLKKKIPEDVAIISFDESEAFGLFYCPITHGRQPLEQIGKLAVNTLLNSIAQPKGYKQLYLESELIIGKSCAE